MNRPETYLGALGFLANGTAWVLVCGRWLAGIAQPLDDKFEQG
jgi:hypothetical protein